MVHYEIDVFSDSGHLMVKNCDKSMKIPDYVNEFVHSKNNENLNVATDKNGYGCRFYILKSDLKNKTTYNRDSDVITINYNVDIFNSLKMEYVNENPVNNLDKFINFNKDKIFI